LCIFFDYKKDKKGVCLFFGWKLSNAKEILRWVVFIYNL